ncbi:major facilitator superfamily transporter, partial [Aureobasidium melanogenum]
MSPSVTCPEKSIASAQLTTDPEKAAPNLEHRTPEATGSTRAIHGIKAIVSVLFSMFMYSLDGTIVAVLVPSIVNEFDSVPLLPWLSVGFMVGSIVTVLPLGKLFSKYNAKWLYVISVVLFLASSALCGAAPTMSAMIVGRVFLGMSGNGIYFGIMTLLSVYTHDKERPMYLSLVGLVWGIGTVLGPVVGGGFDKVSWRWAFYLNLIIGGVFAPVYLFMLPSFDPQPKTVSFFGRAKNFDFVGAALSIASILCLVMAINFGNALYAWNSGQIISMFVLSFVLLVVFAVQQKFAWFTTKTERMFPAHLIKNKEANLLFICAACANTAGFLPIYYLPVYFQFSRGDDALEAAVRLLPLITILSATIIVNGYLMSKLGYYQPWYIGGAAVALIGNVLASRVNTHTSVSAIFGYEVLIALGSGAFIQAGYATIQTVVSADDTSYGIAYMMLAQFAGIVMGLSIGGAIFINEALESLKVLLPMLPEDQLRSVISGTSSDAISKIPVELREQAISALVDSLRKIFIPSYVAAAVALVTAVFLKKSIKDMQSTRSELYIMTVLIGAQTELDLSGDQPFNLSITLTLHAKAPVICYIDPEDTFFIRRNALHSVGIRFRDQRTNKIQERTERACTGYMETPNPVRPLGGWSRLYLSPGKPMVFEVAFTGHKDRGCGRSFNPSFYMATCGFKAGRTYEATLPTDRKISWWRWASFWEAEGQGQEASAITSVLWSIVRSGVSWWTGDKERTQGVPVLPENEQLPIYIQGDSVVFSCVESPWSGQSVPRKKRDSLQKRNDRFGGTDSFLIPTHEHR